jgi:hypothetical protein
VAVKNLLELKTAQRVLIRGNVLENSWPSSQVGFAVLFTVRSCQDGDFPWAVVKDVVFESNIVRHAAYGINLLGRDDNRSACVATGTGSIISNGLELSGVNTNFTGELKELDYVWTAKRTGAGTVAVASKSNVISGTGTRFSVEVRPGDSFYVNGVKRIVKTVVSDTQLLVTVAFDKADTNSFQFESRAQIRSVTGPSTAILVSAFVSNVTSPVGFRYNTPRAGETSNITIRNNVMYDIGTQWGGGGGGAFVQIVDGVNNLTVDHNTMIGNSKYLTAGNWNQSRKSQNFVFTNNLLNAGSMHLDNLGGGKGPLEYYMPGYVFTNNGLVGSYNASLYPANNFYLTSSSQIGYVNSDAGVFALSPASPWKGKASDGIDIGSDVSAVLQATAGVVQ